MNLSQARIEVLESLLLHDKPVKAAELAKETGKDAPTVQMHFIGLVRAGYALSPQKGQYVISAEGKKALELPEVTKKKAMEVLAQVPHERAFHFYAGLGKPLNIYAQDLLQFCNKLGQVPAESVEFHIKRGDFEEWFRFLGDFELATKAALLKGRKMTKEELRAKLHDLCEERCVTLAQIVAQSANAS